VAFLEVCDRDVVPRPFPGCGGTALAGAGGYGIGSILPRKSQIAYAPFEHGRGFVPPDRSRADQVPDPSEEGEEEVPEPESDSDSESDSSDDSDRSVNLATLAAGYISILMNDLDPL
jgi:hypothetical protein